MTQTGYLGYTTLARELPYYGGFCKWYYIDRAQVTSFPVIDPTTQFLKAEPVVTGSWCGPVIVPNDQLGFEEAPKRDSAGLYFQSKVTGFHPGDTAANRINIENLHYYEFLVVGKMRAGGMHLLLGNQFHGLQFDSTYNSTGGKSAGDSFTFTGNFLNKALVLPSFAASGTIAPPAGGLPGTSPGAGEDSNGKSLIFPFTADDTRLEIDWTTERKALYGSYPLFEIWYTEADGSLQLSNTCIVTVDAFPPNTTKFFVTLNVPGPGILVVK